MYKVVSYYQEDFNAINQFISNSRFVWDEHLFYTRNAINSILGDLYDVEHITNRLIENQDHIGNLMRPYYSSTVVNNFVTLLKNHISLTIEFVKVVKAKKDIIPIQQQLQNNSNDIVNLLNELDPSRWPKTVVSDLWGKHMDYTVQQTISRINREWANDIVAVDKNHEVITEFADLFANGIVFQNLEKFSK